MLDISKSGHLDDREIAESLRFSGMSVGRHKVRELVKSFDTTGNEELDEDEFSDMLHSGEQSQAEGGPAFPVNINLWIMAYKRKKRFEKVHIAETQRKKSEKKSRVQLRPALLRKLDAVGLGTDYQREREAEQRRKSGQKPHSAVIKQCSPARETSENTQRLSKTSGNVPKHLKRSKIVQDRQGM